MCRLLGIVSSTTVGFRTLLAERPRSLAALGEEHRDGWGLAAYGGGRWRIHKGTAPASHDPRFLEAAKLSGEILVSHVRKRTVGETSERNTHPFARGRWVFAHNGTIHDRAHVARGLSPARRAEIEGDTDSEAFFAYLLTRIDAAGLVERPLGPATDAVLADAVRECRARPNFGSVNFLLSDGASCYVHRFGRSLYVLERGGRGGRRRPAVFVASEPMTDEPWRELADGTLLRIDSGTRPRVMVV